MFDIHLHVNDKKDLTEIKEKLTRIITLLEQEDVEIKGLDLVIDQIEVITNKVETIV